MTAQSQWFVLHESMARREKAAIGRQNGPRYMPHRHIALCLGTNDGRDTLCRICTCKGRKGRVLRVRTARCPCQSFQTLAHCRIFTFKGELFTILRSKLGSDRVTWRNGCARIRCLVHNLQIVGNDVQCVEACADVTRSREYLRCETLLMYSNT